jgi:hypothetical protein
VNAIMNLSPESLADLASQYLEITHPLLHLVKHRIDTARALDALVHDRPLPLRDEADDDRLTGGDLMWAVGILLNAMEGDDDATQNERDVSCGWLRPRAEIRHGDEPVQCLLPADPHMELSHSEGPATSTRPASCLRGDDGDGSR